MSVLETDGLTKYYGRRVGVDGLDLRLDGGTLCGFLGPNGAGKSTAIRLLLGLLRPSAGSARIFGFDCWRESHRIKEDVGYLPGDLRLYPWLTARAALHLFGRIRRRDLLAWGSVLAEDFGLDLDLRVDRMSRGNRQKLGLLLAMAHRPRLLILDEPTSSLDPIIQEKLKAHLRRLAADGHTVFFSSHTLGEVERLCDEVIILREGRVVTRSSVEELRARARREVLIRWQGERPPSAGSPLPAGLDVVEETPRRWRCEYLGQVDDLTRWLAAEEIQELIIAPPELEALFQGYYEE